MSVSTFKLKSYFIRTRFYLVNLLEELKKEEENLGLNKQEKIIEPINKIIESVNKAIESASYPIPDPNAVGFYHFVEDLKDMLNELPHGEIIDDGMKNYFGEVIFFAFATRPEEMIEGYGDGYSGHAYFFEDGTAKIENSTVSGNKIPWLLAYEAILIHFKEMGTPVFMPIV